MAINSLSTGFRPGVCTSSTRPTAPYEGQQIYETDTDKLLVWNGSAWKQIPSAATAGAVLQVVYGTTNTQQTNASNVAQDTGLTATITPQSSSSKVLVCVEQNGLLKITNDTSITLNLLRGATNIGRIGTEIAVTASGAVNGVGGNGIMVLDEPATTSATTYKTQFLSYANNATVVVQHNGARSTIVLMEISA